MKDKKGVRTTNAFQKVSVESNRKPNETCVDKGSEFYNRLMKSWLRDKNIEIYSMQNVRNFFFAENLLEP